MWASKWNDRAYYSCKKAGIGQEFVQMAVLVQRLVEAEYAFVVGCSSHASSYSLIAAPRLLLPAQRLPSRPPPRVVLLGQLS